MKSLVLSKDVMFREALRDAESSGDWSAVHAGLRSGKYGMSTAVADPMDVVNDFADVNISNLPENLAARAIFVPRFPNLPT